MHDAEATREAILNAAEEVFAQHGFDGARIDAIAEKAGYNKSLIFQYFDDKLGLYAAVVGRADEQTRVMQDQALMTLRKQGVPLSPEQIKNMLRDYVGWYFDYLVEHPRVMRIFNWELAEGWQTFSKIMTQRDFDDVDQFAPILQKFQEAGLLHSKIDPLVQFSSALFMSHVYLGILPLYKVLIPDADLSSPTALKSAREFIIEFVVNGFLIAPVEAKP
jgi:AcrR family transcriptional regulator